MLVVNGSGVATKSTKAPSGEIVVIPPWPIVATQMLPQFSSARLS